MRLPRAGKLLWAIIAVSLFVHVFCLIAGRTFLEGWRWANHPVHAAVETMGALIALLVAAALLSLERRGSGTNFNVRIASALIGMGVLDGLHAVAHAGEVFVWLHSAASFTGGVLFMLLWVPRKPGARSVSRWPRAVFAITSLVGVGSLIAPGLIPSMIRDGEFTSFARNLNLVGGGLLFVAAARLVQSYLREKNTDDLLFCMHCSLFGAAAIMFEQSVLWDAPWWGWHILRLLAYVVALGFVISTYQRSEAQARVVQAELLARRERETELVADELAKVRDEVVRKARLATIGQIAASIAHELRNPLGAMRNATFYLRRHVKSDNPKYGEYLDIMDQEVSAADRVIRDMMEMARSKAPVKETVELGPTLDEILLQLRPPAGIRCEVSLEPDPFLVSADSGQLRQVMSNILHNAIQVMEHEGEIRVTARHEPDQDVITVEDSGPGVAPADRERVFEPLFTTKAKGTGLGLAICQQIVQSHGGSIGLIEHAGSGAKFSIRFPHS